MGLERDHVPDEIVIKILSFLSPIDIVRARSVSRWISSITYDHELWKILYANACFPRPPGPFSYQSTGTLERVLLRSARLAETWTTRPMKEVSSSETRLPSFGPDPFLETVCGRWIIHCEKDSQIVSYDTLVNKPSGTPLREVIWGAGIGESITLKGFFSVSSMEAETVYIVVFSKPVTPNPSLKRLLLEFRPNGESLEFCSSLSIPIGEFNSQIYSGNRRNGPFLYIQDLCVVFDTRTRVFYTFPPFSTQLDEIQAQIRNPCRVLLTDTYIIVLTDSVVRDTRDSALVQAFTPPQDICLQRSPNHVSILQLTHESIGLTGFPLLIPARDSIVTSLNRSTNLRFVAEYREARHVSLRCIDFTLPEPRHGSVLPISFEVHDIITTWGPFSLSGSPSRIHFYLDMTGDGYIRGYYRIAELDGDDLVWGFRYITAKFTIDTTQERCQAIIGEPSLQDKHNHVTKPVLTTCFDGVRGRICYLTRQFGTINPCHNIVHVIDIE